MATTKKAAFSSNHDEDGLVDFDQILSDLCDLEHQLNEQSNLNDARVPDVFDFSSPPHTPKQPSCSAVIFKDYSQLMTSSPSKAKLSTNGPNRPSDQVIIPGEVGTDLDCALLELSSLIGPGFGFDGNTEPAASVQGSRSTARGNRLHSNQLRKVANGTNNNVHPRSKSMENCQQYQQKVLPNSLVPRSDGSDRLSDGGQNDSVFEDDVSIPSSGSRVSMATSSRSSRSSIANGGAGIPNENDESQRCHETSKTALNKNNQTDPKKTFIQVYSPEGNCVNAAITEQMKVWQVVDQLLTNSDEEPNLSWSLVEQLPGLWMERLLEDSERMTEVILAWTKDSENRILLVERSDKYDAFAYPEKYMTVIEDKNKKCDDSVRQVLIQEFLNSNCRLPEFDGMLYIKLEGKKAWKKLYFILRSSGIYYNPKGKSKSLIDLICLQRLDLVEVYTGIGWKKKYKAPSDFSFALKHPQIQKKAHKYIKYFCAEDVNSMWHWVNSIRLAKYGQQLHDSFVERKDHVSQFYGEDSASRSKQTALIQEKISEMLSQQQTDSVPSFCSAAETSALPMQTFRAESPDGSKLRMISCLEENGKPPARLFRSPVHLAASTGHGVDQTRSPGRIVPPSKSPKKPLTESISVHHLGPSSPPRAVSGDGVRVDAWNDPGFPVFNNNNSHEMLSGSVDQLQSVGSNFGRQKTPVTVPGGSGGGSARWTTSQKHAIIKRTPSIGHRDIEDPTPPVNRHPRLGPPTSPKPQPLPKPSFTPATTTGASQLRSSLPPVRRKFPSSTSFSDCDDAAKTSPAPISSPKPKPPLPPKRMDLMKQSLSADNSPCHRALSSGGELPKKPPLVHTRPSSASSSQQGSLSPSSPLSCETWQNSSFLVDLERVILQKRANGPRAGEGDGEDLGDLPPPPVALLAGLKNSNRPPLPPKRSNETKLSYK